MITCYLIRILVLFQLQILPPLCFSIPNHGIASQRYGLANMEYNNPESRQQLSRERDRRADFNKTKRDSKCQSKGLFNPHDVVILEEDTLDKAVHGSPTFWYVLFYAHWCGHCIHFSKTWKAVGHDTKGWTKYVHVAAIDCAEQRNDKICRRYEVLAYPTIRTFKPYSHKGSTGKPFGQYEFAGIRNSILDTVINDKNFSQVFEPVTLRSLKTIDKSGGSTVLIFQKTDSNLGEKLILDFSNYKNLHIKIASSDDKDMMKKFAVKSLPTMYHLHKKKKFSEINVSHKTRQSFRKALQQIDNEKPYIEPLPKSKYKRSMAVHLTDLISTLSHMFQSEIPNQMHVMGTHQLDALRNFVSVIGQYFPNQEVRERFTNLLYQIDGETSIFKIKLDLKFNKLKLPRDVSWVGCEGSKTRYRGYPCGCWQLFHTLIIRSYYNYQPGQFSPIEVLYSVIGYVKFFFGCRECRNNFVQLSKSVDKEVRSGKEAVMWLWKIHNQVNKRLHGDISEDPEHPKIQFPNEKLCGNCRDKNHHWLENNVLKFLHKFYVTKLIKNELPGNG